MDLKFVVPNMKETFGNLTFAGNADAESQGSGRNRRVTSRTYNLFSDKQRADNISVTVTGNLTQKPFVWKDKVELVNPRIVAEGRNVDGTGHPDYKLYADDIVKKEN